MFLMFDKKVKPNSEDGDSLQIMLLLVKQYEDLHIPFQNPIPLRQRNKNVGIPAEVLLS